MLPLARELLQRGTAVVLAANSLPSINDITATELAEAVQIAGTVDPIIKRSLMEGVLTVVPSGNDLPVIDLRKATLPLAESLFMPICQYGFSDVPAGNTWEGSL